MAGINSIINSANISALLINSQNILGSFGIKNVNPVFFSEGANNNPSH